jgi:inorganic pyrophosphatase/exopolyphosphatase
MPELIFFADDINQPGIIERVQEVALIDHNKLDVTQEALLGSRVKRIVDHHIDNNLYTYSLQEKQIELIGSATTLAIERLLKEFPGSIDAELAHFLKAPILLDSYHFEPSLKDSKWTDKDL